MKRRKIDPLKIRLFQARLKQSTMARELRITQSMLSLWLNLQRPWREGMREQVEAYIEAHEND